MMERFPACKNLNSAASSRRFCPLRDRRRKGSPDGSLDLDDIGAQVGKKLRRVRPGYLGREVDDADITQYFHVNLSPLQPQHHCYVESEHTVPLPGKR